VHNTSSENKRNVPAGLNRSYIYPTAQAQAFLILSIPDFPPSREGKKPLDEQYFSTKLSFETASNQLNGPIFVNCKIPELFEKSPLSGAGKHPQFQG
jgi:hypothetical protein